MYYIEGTIEAIDFETTNNVLRFSLLPDTGYSRTFDNGTKRAMFINEEIQDNLAENKQVVLTPSSNFVECMKNVDGKECLWFSIRKCLLQFIKSAKDNRNTLRVWCADCEPHVPTDPFSYSPVSTIEAKGIRVF